MSKSKVTSVSIISALTDLGATCADRAVSYFEIAAHLKVKPLDSEGVANLKKQCLHTRDAGQVMYIPSSKGKNISLLYLRT